MARRDAGRIERALHQCAVPLGSVDVHGPDLDAVVLRVAYELGGSIEPHGLRIQDRGAEDIRIEGLEPAGGIDKQGKGGGMAFGKAIVAKAFYLAEAAFGELFRKIGRASCRERV